MSKGSRPRPFSVTRPFSVNHETFANNYDAIFGRNKVDKYQCYCYNCKFATDFEYTVTHMIVCPECGNKRCPHATDHKLACTNSNEPGQPGSRYQ